MNYRNNSCTVFAGTRSIASGPLQDVAGAAKALLDQNPAAQILIFDDLTSEPVEIDFRGSAEDVLRRLPAEPEPAPETEPRRPGRPKLGVVAREVTLLPRHWEWLAAQPGGASVALRKLVDQARHANGARDRVRRAQEAAYRFLSAMAGNEPGFEEAIRALFAGRRERFGEMTEGWPADIRSHARKLAAAAFTAADET
jgi:uncharacterized protein